MKYFFLQLFFIVLAVTAALQLVGPVEEPLTELYFVDHASLPAALNPPNVAIEPLATRTYSFYRVTYMNGSLPAVIDVFNDTETLNATAVAALFPGILPNSLATQVRAAVNDSSLSFYREAPNALPAPLTTTQTVTFVVRNQEYQNMTYAYEVVQTTKGLEELIANGTIAVPANEEVFVPVSFTVVEGFNKTKIEVALRERAEFLQFWVEEEQ